MIILVHNNIRIVKVFINGVEYKEYCNNRILITFKEVVEKYPNEIVCWCDERVFHLLNIEEILTSLNIENKILSFSLSNNEFTKKIGYLDYSPFININRNVTYPTWIISNLVGCAKTSLFKCIDEKFWDISKFDVFLISLGKHYHNQGLLSYSEPKLLKSKDIKIKNSELTVFEIVTFIKEHYKRFWLYLFVLNLLFFERKLILISLIKSFFLKTINYSKELKIESIDLNKVEVSAENVDVIIPTIGRKIYLHQVLKDLASQSHLPKKVIIVEQNPLPETTSELNFILDEVCPFQIEHIFTQQTGACNARNVALSKCKGDWVFLNDDDNRFDQNLIEEALITLKGYNLDVITTTYLQEGERNGFTKMVQSENFGSGNTFITKKIADLVRFDMNLEFGYGEDTEFGMQIRNFGFDVIYSPNLKILHLKAPMGGFRTKFVHPWESEKVLPKPSPTIMYVRKKYHTLEQIKGFKLLLFLKYYKNQSIKNPFKYYKTMQKQWEVSEKWAEKLKSQPK